MSKMCVSRHQLSLNMVMIIAHCCLHIDYDFTSILFIQHNTVIMALCNTIHSVA